MDDEYEDYHEKKVVLLVDGRGYDKDGRSCQATPSLELSAKVCGESETLLHLEEIIASNRSILNRPAYSRARPPYSRGSLRKDYIIGIFLLPSEEAHP